MGGGGAICVACHAEYPAIGSILDLRIPGASWIDHKEDRDRALRLLALGEDATSRQLVEEALRRRLGWDDAHLGRRIHQALSGVQRLRRDVVGWLHPVSVGPGTVLDLFRRETQLTVRIEPAPVPTEDLERMGPRRALLARVYNVLVASVLARWLFRAVGPFFHVHGHKRAGAA